MSLNVPMLKKFHQQIVFDIDLQIRLGVKCSYLVFKFFIQNNFAEFSF